MAEPLRGFRWVRNDSGGQPVIQKLRLYPGTTAYRGSVVSRVVAATAGSAEVRLSVATNTSLLGFMLHSYTTTATETQADVEVCLFTLDGVYAALGGKSTMTTNARTFYGDSADLKIPTAAYGRIDTAASINHFHIVAWPDATDNATGAGREWYLKVVPTALQYAVSEAG